MLLKWDITDSVINSAAKGAAACQSSQRKSSRKHEEQQPLTALVNMLSRSGLGMVQPDLSVMFIFVSQKHCDSQL